MIAAASILPPPPSTSHRISDISAATSYAGEDSSEDLSSSLSSAVLDNGIPDEFVCPLTLEIFEYPVMDRYGKNFERAAIMKWFSKGHSTCPLTRRELKPSDLVTNSSLKLQIDEWRKEYNQPSIDDVRPGEDDELIGVITMAIQETQREYSENNSPSSSSRRATFQRRESERAIELAQAYRRRRRVIDAARGRDIVTTNTSDPESPGDENFQIRDESITLNDLPNYNVPIEQLSTQQIELIQSLVQLRLNDNNGGGNRRRSSGGRRRSSAASTGSGKKMANFWKKLVSP